MARWAPGVGAAALVALALIAASPAAASVTSDRYGGTDRTINTDAEVRSVVAAMDADANLLNDLSATERQYVIDRGLTVAATEDGQSADLPPAGTPVTTEPVDATGTTAAVAVAYPTGSQTLTFYCQAKSIAGNVLWRLNSRWYWRYLGGIVKSANHADWGGHLAPGWDFDWTKYLTGYGHVGRPMVGRAVQGKFRWAPGGWTVFTKLPILTVKVYATGYHYRHCDSN